MSSDTTYGSDYYDPHPRAYLARPVLLVGQPGAAVAVTARALSATMGLPFHHIERVVEARTGRARARVLLEDGAAALHGRDAKELRSALAQKPCGIVTTDALGLVDPLLTAWVRMHALVVWVRRPSSYLLRRIRREVADQPGSLPDFVYSVPATVRELEPQLALREDALASAHEILDAGERAPGAVADDVRALIEARHGFAKTQ